MVKRIEAKLIRIFESIFYFFVIVTFQLLLLILFVRIKIEGKENIPKKGRFILAANHENFFDGFFLACVVGATRKVGFVIARRAVKLKFCRFLLKMMSSVIIGNEPEEYQRALKKLNRILSHGGIIGIFPEGDVSSRKVPRKFKGGVAKLSLDSKTKVLPIYLKGTYNLRNIKYLLKRPEVTVRIGKPFDLYNYAKLCENNLEQMAGLLREKIIELMGIKEYDNLTALDSRTLNADKLLAKKDLSEQTDKIQIAH